MGAVTERKPTTAQRVGTVLQDTGTILTNTLRNWGTNIPGDVLQGFSPKAAEHLNTYTGGVLNHTTQEQLEANRNNPTKDRWRDSAVNTNPGSGVWNSRVAAGAQGASSIVGGQLIGAAVQRVAAPLFRGASKA